MDFFTNCITQFSLAKQRQGCISGLGASLYTEYQVLIVATGRNYHCPVCREHLSWM